MSRKIYIVALTGGIGSGKSTVAELFAQHGVHIVDTDTIAHTLTASGGGALAAIRDAFGDGVLDREGALDRPHMRARIFEDGDARARLEAILHPMIRVQVDAALSSEPAAQAPYVMLAVPLLFETMGYRWQVDRTLAVDCPVDVQRLRVQKRSGLAMVDIDRIIASQLGRSLRLQLADDIIVNSTEKAGLVLQVTHLHGRFLMSAQVQR